jgi:nicotinamidase/pyrazinamidase
MQTNVQLLVIDPQNDFCDLPEAHCPADPLGGGRLAPALPVAGAHADMQRLAGFIRAASSRLDGIAVTLDSHNRLHIAHPTFWQRGDGGVVEPFTSITARQVRAGEFLPRDPQALPRALAYLDALDARGRYTLMVWPVHCEVGSWGHNVHADVRAAYNAWEVQRLAVVRKVAKGSNLWTEHYSALQAEVPDPSDPRTLLNRPFLDELDRAGLLFIAGEAGSHCVKSTTVDIVENLPGGRPERIVMLTDCMSPVGGFRPQHDAFLADMRSRGVRLATAAEALSLLPGNATR